MIPARLLVVRCCQGISQKVNAIMATLRRLMGLALLEGRISSTMNTATTRIGKSAIRGVGICIIFIYNIIWLNYQAGRGDTR